jgi:hypothetical protein
MNPEFGVLFGELLSRLSEPNPKAYFSVISEWLDRARFGTICESLTGLIA